MSQVVFDGKYIRVGSTKIALLSGEFHYWRNNKKWWPQILSGMKAAGFEVISSYVCWGFQEVSPGQCDFTGETNQQRDLDGFLDLCHEMGLYVIIRPGPYIYSEYPYSGVPEHAAQYHRLHPTFLKKSEKYLNDVCAVIRPHLATNGGPVIMVQVDNEVDMCMCTYTAGDTFSLFEERFYEQAVARGKADQPGTFRHWLKRKYKTVDRLNAAWGLRLKSFDDAKLFVDWPATSGERQRLIDTNQFHEDYSTEFLGVVSAMYRRAGIDVPLYANAYGSPQPMNIPDMQKIVALVGTDHYSPNMMPGSSVRDLGISVRRSGAQAPLRYIAEFMSGILGLWTNSWGFGMIAPEHHRYMGLAAMLAGAQGWSWYMFVEREEWYFSPINERGEIRNHYWRHFRDLVKMWHELDWTAYENVTRCSLFWYRPQHYLSKDLPWRFGIPRRLTEVPVVSRPRKSPFDRAAEVLHDADVDYAVYDPYGAYNKTEPGRLLIYSGLDFIEPEVEGQLLALARSGNTVAFLGGYPGQTLSGKATQLSRLLPPLKTAVSWGGPLELRYEDQRLAIATDNLLHYEESKLKGSRPIYAGGGLCGCVAKLGKGKLVLLGLNPSVEAVRFISGIAGVREACQSMTPGVLTSAWRKGREAALVVLNTNDAESDVELDVDLRALGFKSGDRLQVTDMLGRKKRTISGKQLASYKTRIGGKDGLVVHIKKAG